MRLLTVLLFALVVGLAGGACGGGSGAILPGRVDNYVALAPRVFRAGETETVSLTLFSGPRLARTGVEVTLTRDGQEVAKQTADISGKGAIAIPIPADASGEYELEVKGSGFEDKATVQVQDGTLLFVETDKPIYKPGQTIMVRVVTLNSELKPLPTTASIEIADAKGNKIFKQDVTSDEFGMATLQLPLSTEPNLGVWKISAKAGDTLTDIDVRVEEYVLPKYEIDVQLEKPWFLVSEPIKGAVDVTYSFGKPVTGELTLKATRYVGIWEEFATTTADVVDGKAQFEVIPAQYTAGVAEAGGNGNVQLDFTVTERNTGYEEKTTELITVAAAPVTIQLIPETPAFKPGLPFNVLVVTETPDGQAVDANVDVNLYWTDEDYNSPGQDLLRVSTSRGVGTATFTPPDDAQQLSINANSGDQAWAYTQINAAYSPSGNFIHVSQTGDTELLIGDEASFHVDSTSEARTFYYEVVSRDRVVFTQAVRGNDFSFKVTPAMAGANKLLVYQVLPTSEVAADFIPFDVEAMYPHEVSATFNEEESLPGDAVEVELQTEGRAKVGVAAVDRSVFILAENRLNLQQVFDQIEALYQLPQAELHEGEFFNPGPIVIPGAEDTFKDAGLVVMTSHDVPEGRELEFGGMFFADAMADGDDAAELRPQAGVGGVGAGPAALPASGEKSVAQLAEVQRTRQFFPETWIWQDAVTDDDGHATISVDAPDSITTWDLRAIAISPEHGLGVAEAELRVFQPFFLTADLPYSAIRGEEFPLKVSLYNYTDSEQEFQVDIEDTEWFDLIDDATKTVTVAANDTGSVEFMIRPTGVGTQTVKVTARSSDSADAVIKSMIVEPEGVQREQVQNGVLNAGASKDITWDVPDGIVPNSERAFVAVAGSLLAQTISGLDQLLGMPYGCGEQNMLLFAPDVYILRYLDDTGQLKPEIRAKIETLLVTGYQRELTYRRADGSFSAFGDQDEEGSLFLTAFVMKTFAEAKDMIYVDDAVLADAATWITSHQKADGSFESVGFVHHSELMGGVAGADALTAYIAVALQEAGQTASAAKAIDFLEGRVDAIDDPYALALTSYALELADSEKAADAHTKLMAAAVEDEDGLHWTGERGDEPIPIEGDAGFEFAPYPGQVSGSSDIEATGYATLALTEHDDKFNAGRAAKWLAAHRNSFGGFGSTQDTVVALQALTRYASSAGEDTNMTVTIRAGGETHEVQITPDNFDVLQVVDVPAGAPVSIETSGEGQAVFQAVQRYNLPRVEEEPGMFDITVDYDATNVSVNDVLGIDVTLKFQPPEPIDAGMIVLDVSVPTGFAPVSESLDALAAANPKIKRYDVAGRKVIFYLEDVTAGETLTFSFDVLAQYPVRGKGAATQAYSYYTPELRGEVIGDEVTIEP